MGIAALCVALVAAAPGLRMGVDRIDITPPLSMKASLGGYGERMSRPATGIHDRVWAKAMVLRQGGRRFAIVTADILGFPPGFKDAVAGRLAASGWRADDVLLLASHSHTSIDFMAINQRNRLGIPQMGVFQQALFEHTRDRVARVIQGAAHAPVAVRVGSGKMHLPAWNRNRRAGCTEVDDALTLLRVDTAAGRPLAVLVNWTAHPTFMDAEDMEFSADWPGHLQRRLEAVVGPGVTAMFCNGAEGDQSPTPRGGANGYERAQRYGEALAEQALALWRSVRTVEAGELVVHVQPIALPTPAWHPDFMRTGGAEYGMTPQAAAAVLAQLAPASSHSTSVRIGDFALVGIPGEMAADLGLEVKRQVRERTGVRHVAIGGLADEWLSYLLTPEQYRKGGYEASMSLYGEKLGPVVALAAAEGAGR